MLHILRPAIILVTLSTTLIDIIPIEQTPQQVVSEASVTVPSPALPEGQISDDHVSQSLAPNELAVPELEPVIEEARSTVIEPSSSSLAPLNQQRQGELQERVETLQDRLAVAEPEAFNQLDQSQHEFKERLETVLGAPEPQVSYTVITDLLSIEEVSQRERAHTGIAMVSKTEIQYDATKQDEARSPIDYDTFTASEGAAADTEQITAPETEGVTHVGLLEAPDEYGGFEPTPTTSAQNDATQDIAEETSLAEPSAATAILESTEAVQSSEPAHVLPKDHQIASQEVVDQTETVTEAVTVAVDASATMAQLALEPANISAPPPESAHTPFSSQPPASSNLVSQKIANQIIADQVASSQEIINQRATEQKTMNQAVADQDVDQKTVNQVVAAQETISQTVVDQAAVNQESMNQAVADQEMTDQVAIDSTAYSARDAETALAHPIDPIEAAKTIEAIKALGQSPAEPKTPFVRRGAARAGSNQTLLKPPTAQATYPPSQLVSSPILPEAYLPSRVVTANLESQSNRFPWPGASPISRLSLNDAVLVTSAQAEQFKRARCDPERQWDACQALVVREVERALYGSFSQAHAQEVLLTLKAAQAHCCTTLILLRYQTDSAQWYVHHYMDEAYVALFRLPTPSGRDLVLGANATIQSNYTGSVWQRRAQDSPFDLSEDVQLTEARFVLLDFSQYTFPQLLLHHNNPNRICSYDRQPAQAYSTFDVLERADTNGDGNLDVILHATSAPLPECQATHRLRTPQYKDELWHTLTFVLQDHHLAFRQATVP